MYLRSRRHTGDLGLAEEKSDLCVCLGGPLSNVVAGALSSLRFFASACAGLVVLASVVRL